MTEAPSPADVRPTSGLLKALADDTRLRMVALLARGELCVCDIASALEVSQSNASQHLTVLRNAGVVESRRQGSWIYYRMSAEQDPLRARILRAILDGFGEAGAAGEGPAPPLRDEGRDLVRVTPERAPAVAAPHSSPRPRSP